MFTLFTKVQYILHFTSLIFFPLLETSTLSSIKQLNKVHPCGVVFELSFNFIYIHSIPKICALPKKKPKSINYFSSVVFFMLGIYTHIYYVLGIISPMFWTTAVVCGRASNFDWKKHTQKLARFPNRGHVFYIDSILIFKICIAILNQKKKNQSKVLQFSFKKLNLNIHNQ